MRFAIDGLNDISTLLHLLGSHVFCQGKPWDRTEGLQILPLLDQSRSGSYNHVQSLKNHMYSFVTVKTALYAPSPSNSLMLLQCMRRPALGR